VVKNPVTLSGMTTPDKIYDGLPYAPLGTVNCSPSFPLEQLEWLYESTDAGGYSSSTTPTDAGAYRLTVSVPEMSTHYSGSWTSTFTIEKREIALVAHNKAILPGDDMPPLTYKIVNLPSGKSKSDALSAEPILACPEFDSYTLGTYAITLTGGTETHNYIITARTDGTLTVAEHIYTVTFNLGGGTHTGGGDLSQVVAIGTAAEAPTVTRSGYAFIGWDKAFDHVTSDLVVTARWVYLGSDDWEDDAPSTTGTAPGQPPDLPLRATASVTASAGVGGQAALSVSGGTIAEANRKAQAQGTAGGVAVELAAELPEGTTSLSFTLDRPALSSLVTAGVFGLTLSGSLGAVSFDRQALSEIARRSSGSVTLSFVPATGLSNAARAHIGGRPVFDIRITYTDKDGNSRSLTSFENGRVTLAIPYTPQKGEAAGHLYGVYVDSAGRTVRIPGSVYDANSAKLLITTRHFSVYGVGYTAPPHTFADIGSHWAIEAIDYVAGRELLPGTSQTTFSPDAPITRGALATALGKLHEVDPNAYPTRSFADVDESSAPYIEWAYNMGLINPVTDQKFAPNRTLSREEVALVFANTVKAAGYKLPVARTGVVYADASGIGSVYREAVLSMQQTGIVMGGANNRFNPKSPATRGEIAAMLHRLIKLSIDPDTAQGWALNDSGQWFYYKEGKALTGAQTIGGMQYFFGADGKLKTGWVLHGGYRRYYRGNKVLTGWWIIGDKVSKTAYFFDDSGNLLRIKAAE
jgi:fibronectin-binding autotransporter adhesin